MNRIVDTIIFSLAFVTFIIGVHQTINYGLQVSYFIFMVSIAFLLWIKLRRDRHTKGDKSKK